MKCVGVWFIFLALSLSKISAQSRLDIVITEIMADPSPAVGLPGNEWIELRNRSAAPVSLQGWRIGDAGNTSGPLPNYVLLPDSSVILCPASALAAMSAFGPAISVSSFPSLDNDGDIIQLRSPNGRSIHAVAYTTDWYRNEIKKNGGWTLEMVDTDNPCTGAGNWQASTDTRGGTPGGRNSVAARNTDQEAPQLLRALSADTRTLLLIFNEPLDSLSASPAVRYRVEGGPAVVSVSVLPPLFHEVQLRLAADLLPGTTYEVFVSGVMDCSGHAIDTRNRASTGLPTQPMTGDCVINEILFNPRSNASDFVEMLNRSNKIIDLSRLYIANRSSSGVVSNSRVLSASPWYLFPQEYLVVTDDPAAVLREYLVQEPDKLLPVQPMPSFPDDKGTVVLHDFSGEVLDEVSYHKDWHFKLLQNTEGVSLERIDPAAASRDAANWHSAASTAGFATPTYRNSQYKNAEITSAQVEIKPAVFSPDNDGRDDRCSIHYQVEEAGFVANVTIYNAAGRPVRYLVRNNTLGRSGYWNWEGLDDRGGQLPLGPYVMLAEFFHPNGRRFQVRKTVVLARPLR